MQMPRAEDALASRAHAAGDEIEPLLADVALGCHVRLREDPKEAHS